MYVNCTYDLFQWVKYLRSWSERSYVDLSIPANNNKNNAQQSTNQHLIETNRIKTLSFKTNETYKVLPSLEKAGEIAIKSGRQLVCLAVLLLRVERAPLSWQPVYGRHTLIVEHCACLPDIL